MKYFNVVKVRKRKPFDLFYERDKIYMEANYQFSSEDWTVEKKRLYIDSMINGFDLPKIYMRGFLPPVAIHGHYYDFAMIEGKQAACAIFDFLNGDLRIANDFVFHRDRKVQVGGMTYVELAETDYYARMSFEKYELDIVEINFDDDAAEEVIGQLFDRHYAFANTSPAFVSTGQTGLSQANRQD